MDAIDELTQLENLEHQIDEINIQLIELNETLQLEESGMIRKATRYTGITVPYPINIKITKIIRKIVGSKTKVIHQRPVKKVKPLEQDDSDDDWSDF